MAAHTPWSFIDLEGETHTPRPFSAPEALDWLERFRWAGSDPWKQARTISRLLRTLFPWTPRYLVPRAIGGRADPWHAFHALPGPVQAELLQDFFVRAGLLNPVPRTPMMTSPS